MKSFFDHFGLLAPYYEVFIHPQPPKKLVSLIHPESHGIILDAGGGTGRVSQYLHSQATQIVVADEAYKMLREAQKKDGIQTACSHTESLPFKSNSFTLIIMVDALHHVADQPKTAAELWRVLAPGGQIIIEEPNIQLSGVKAMALAEKLALMRSHFLSPAQMLNLFQDNAAKKRLELEDTSAWIIIEK